MALLRTEIAARLDEIAEARAEAIENRSFLRPDQVQERLGQLDRDAAAYRARLAESIDREEEGSAAQSAEAADYWFKRFLTTLGVANAGAFAALATGALQAEKPAVIAPLVAPAMIWFTWGMLCAGAVPLFLWLRYRADSVLKEMFEDGDYPLPARPLIEGLSQFVVIFGAGASILLFATGLFTALGALQGIVPR